MVELVEKDCETDVGNSSELHCWKREFRKEEAVSWLLTELDDELVLSAETTVVSVERSNLGFKIDCNGFKKTFGLHRPSIVKLSTMLSAESVSLHVVVLFGLLGEHVSFSFVVFKGSTGCRIGLSSPVVPRSGDPKNEALAGQESSLPVMGLGERLLLGNSNRLAML